ncbi:TMEM175 family protein [Bradyrhizobium sp. ISRA464]|uniref:TMEM175 family protein n=1 Tax=Bradyrhizobium sp. ISRA464 TaxID=2866200 RepID=UPI002478AE74|nr:TMEM175 family protein [Bradyrhizobium sp. ISRA464]WGS28714.1 TMEM175 family protein [Bradyrhizobium sp. ISRA464]
MEEKRPSADRLGAFSDAVIAVIITVMVLELKAPEGSAFADLLPLWPTAISYAASYLFIAVIWVNHHHLLHLVRQSTPRLIWLNFVHLFAVSLLPFATAWVARSHMAAAPVVVYAVIFLVIDLAYLAFERAVLAQADQSVISERVRRWTQVRTLLAVLVFAAGAAIAPFMPLLGFATVCCALLLYLRPEAISGFARQIKS